MSTYVSSPPPGRLQYVTHMHFCHPQELETYSRAASSRGSSVASVASGRSSGLDLDRSRKYRTDSVSLRAAGHSPPFANLEDIRNDETRDVARDYISEWLSSVSVTSESEEEDEPSASALASTSRLEENEYVLAKIDSPINLSLLVYFKSSTTGTNKSEPYSNPVVSNQESRSRGLFALLQTHPSSHRRPSFPFPKRVPLQK
jgi:hypothetical protein